MQILVVLDNIFNINPKKDSSFAILLAAKQRGYKLFCCNSYDIYANKSNIYANTIHININDTTTNFVQVISRQKQNLTNFGLVLMRKDPPFNVNYIYTTHLLELAEKQGVKVVNKPRALRDFNEKLAILNFPNCITDTIITSNQEQILAFLKQQKTVVIKPLNSMGGHNIFKLSANKLKQATTKINKLIINNTPIMAQRYLAEIKTGDKRILLINGTPIPYALNRTPANNNWKGNLVQGAIGTAQPLTNKDKWLCAQIAPTLTAKGLTFIGIDVIGNYISEINVTSPTGIRELDKQCDLNIADTLLTQIINK